MTTIMKDLGVVYSNFNHELNIEILPALIKEEATARHTAWNFCGIVWHKEGKWYEKIMQYKVEQEVIIADKLEDCIKLANDSYGYE